MHCIYNKKSTLTALSLVVSVLQVGCQTAPGPAYPGYGSASRYGVLQQQGEAPVQPAGVVAAGTAPAPYAQAWAQQQAMVAAYTTQQQTAEANTAALKDRLERVEKALIRLDRRMQLVERNELNRMSDGGSAPRPALASLDQPSTAVPLPNKTPTNSIDDQAAMRALEIGAPQGQSENTYTGGFQPVSAPDDRTIRSALQAAPSSDMPSLADTSPASGKAARPATDVAVWTVRYDDPGKVWPDRAQLPSSREVVQALRDNGTVTLFARGPNPNDKQFRERVKALSRYLSKVSSVDSVPIAALPSPQMDPQTIEILATH